MGGSRASTVTSLCRQGSRRRCDRSAMPKRHNVFGTDQPKNRTFVPGGHVSSSPSRTRFDATGPFITGWLANEWIDAPDPSTARMCSRGRRVISPTAKVARACGRSTISATTSSAVATSQAQLQRAHKAAAKARPTPSAHPCQSQYKYGTLLCYRSIYTPLLHRSDPLKTHLHPLR